MKKNFSKEYLFELDKIKNHAIGITFRAGSLSSKLYGSDIVIDLILDDSEFESLTRNYLSKPTINTYGRLRANALVEDRLTEDQIERLKSEGFFTDDIFEISHL